MSYHSLPERYPGMYRQREDGTWETIPSTTPKKGRLCFTSYCRKRVPANQKNRTCVTCRTRVWRANNPIKATFLAAKSKAKRRGLPFELTFEYFTALCEATDYHLLRGREAGDLHLDRIDNSLGYLPGNVRAVTASQNCRKARQEPGYHASSSPDDADPF